MSVVKFGEATMASNVRRIRLASTGSWTGVAVHWRMTSWQCGFTKDYEGKISGAMYFHYDRSWAIAALVTGELQRLVSPRVCGHNCLSVRLRTYLLQQYKRLTFSLRYATPTVRIH